MPPIARVHAAAFLMLALAGAAAPWIAEAANPRLATRRAIVDFSPPGPLSPVDSVLLVLGGALAEVLVVPGDVHRANRALAEPRLHAALVPVRDGMQLRVAHAFASP